MTGAFGASTDAISYRPVFANRPQGEQGASQASEKEAGEER